MAVTWNNKPPGPFMAFSLALPESIVSAQSVFPPCAPSVTVPATESEGRITGSVYDILVMLPTSVSCRVTVLLPCRDTKKQKASEQGCASWQGRVGEVGGEGSAAERQESEVRGRSRVSRALLWD